MQEQVVVVTSRPNDSNNRAARCLVSIQDAASLPLRVYGFVIVPFRLRKLSEKSFLFVVLLY
jgi:hypothetical protein